jgi:hypothetical protein
MTIPDPTPAPEIDLKHGLSAWARRHAIRPVDFARRMEYTPAYGWSLLRGQAAVTVEALGRFVLAYGGEAANELLTLAGLPPVSVETPKGEKA